MQDRTGAITESAQISHEQLTYACKTALLSINEKTDADASKTMDIRHPPNSVYRHFCLVNVLICFDCVYLYFYHRGVLCFKRFTSKTSQTSKVPQKYRQNTGATAKSADANNSAPSGSAENAGQRLNL